MSHETIYKSLFIQARGALKKELLQHLRKTRALCRSLHKTLKGEGLGKITNTVSILERPAEAEDRAVPGRWEGDQLRPLPKPYSHNRFRLVFPFFGNYLI